MLTPAFRSLLLDTQQARHIPFRVICAAGEFCTLDPRLAWNVYEEFKKLGHPETHIRRRATVIHPAP